MGRGVKIVDGAISFALGMLVVGFFAAVWGMREDYYSQQKEIKANSDVISEEIANLRIRLDRLEKPKKEVSQDQEQPPEQAQESEPNMPFLQDDWRKYKGQIQEQIQDQIK